MKTLTAGDTEIKFDESNSLVIFKGSMRLANMKEYGVVTNFLKESANISKEELTLDLKDLEFLNSSGITTLSLFVLDCKKSGTPKIKVLRSETISWQKKSISNFKKLWSEVE